ncbi:MAG: Rrf2 family transcriptional regulator [Blautia sp.]|nr:Rrf2 family transcriptional regulator [Blautia sp.]
MKLSKKSRYGLRALIDLAVNSIRGHVSLNSIAERNEISPQYLEQVFAALRRAGIVKSVKGPQGGYLLNGEADEITLAQILEALEGTYYLEPEEKLDNPDSQKIAETVQELLIDRVNEETERLLKEITLADLEKGYLEKKGYDQNMYYI